MPDLLSWTIEVDFRESGGRAWLVKSGHVSREIRFLAIAPPGYRDGSMAQ
jgi:hypothetical protein